MSSVAIIQPTTNNINLKPGENTVISFTVTNIFGATLNIGSRITSQDSSIDSWISVRPPIEQELSDQDTHVFSVEVNIPQNAQSGQYEFSLLVYSVTDPNLDFSESNPVVIMVAEPEVPSENPTSQDPCYCQKKYFTLTVLAMIILTLIVIITIWCSERNVATHPDEETMTESTTFSKPIRLTGDGRVVKSIILPAYQAHSGRGAEPGLFLSVPGMHFSTTGSHAFSGEALFVIPIPDDIDFNSGVQFRLVWGFTGNPEPPGIAFNWQVGAQFFKVNDSIPAASFQFIQVPVSEVNTRRNDVLVTPFMDFDQTITLNPDSRFAVMQVSLVDPGVAIPQVYLLQAELNYVADRLGKE